MPDFRWLWRARPVRPGETDDEFGVHDGDTLTLELDRGLDGTRTLVPLRLGGPTPGSELWVDAPELGTGLVAHAMTLALLDWLMHAAWSEKTLWPLRVETWRTRTDRHSKTTLARYIASLAVAEPSPQFLDAGYLPSANAHQRRWLQENR